MNEAEKELNIEQQMFSRNENVNLILKRNVVSGINFVNILRLLSNLIEWYFLGIF